MTVDIKTMKVEPKRHTFGHVARRAGADRPASRYEEGMLDLQPTANFHYKPLWGADFWHIDERRTAIRMADWYKAADPRQYYYASYNIARAAQAAQAERNFEFVEKRGLLNELDGGRQAKVAAALIPLRHLEWGANMNCADICDRGYGAAITAPAMFAGADHLGMAQLIGRIGLLMDDNSGSVLGRAKVDWMEAPAWLPLRTLVEASLVTPDWFELFTAQMLCLDGLVYPLVYDRLAPALGGATLGLLTEFMADWAGEHARWVDAVVTCVGGESAANRDLVSGWYADWSRAAAAALEPVAGLAVDAEAGRQAVASTLADLDTRAARLGLTVPATA